MDDLLLLMIFTYPGAISDMMYTFLAKEKTFYREASSTFRVARGFFLSALTTILTMRLMIPEGSGAHTIENWISLLKKSEIVWRYIGTSLAISIVIGLLWFSGSCFKLWIRNLCAEKTKKAFCETQYASTWHDVIRQPEKVDLREAVVIVKNSEGKMVNCGLPFALPNDIRKEPALALSHCEWVEVELDKDQDESMIEGVLVTYSDLQSGFSVEIRHAPKMWEFFRMIQNPKQEEESNAEGEPT